MLGIIIAQHLLSGANARGTPSACSNLLVDDFGEVRLCRILEALEGVRLQRFERLLRKSAACRSLALTASCKCMSHQRPSAQAAGQINDLQARGIWADWLSSSGYLASGRLDVVHQTSTG